MVLGVMKAMVFLVMGVRNDRNGMGFITRPVFWNGYAINMIMIYCKGIVYV